MKKKKDEEVVVAPAVDTYGDFEFVNPLKYERAVASVGSEDKAALMAEYDRLGGFIRYQGSKVLSGAFWDKRTNSPVANPMPKVLRRQAAVVEETIEVVTVEAKGKKAKKKRTLNKYD